MDSSTAIATTTTTGPAPPAAPFAAADPAGVQKRQREEESLPDAKIARAAEMSQGSGNGGNGGLNLRALAEETARTKEENARLLAEKAEYAKQRAEWEAEKAAVLAEKHKQVAQKFTNIEEALAEWAKQCPDDAAFVQAQMVNYREELERRVDTDGPEAGNAFIQKIVQPYQEQTIRASKKAQELADAHKATAEAQAELQRQRELMLQHRRDLEDNSFLSQTAERIRSADEQARMYTAQVEEYAPPTATSFRDHLYRPAAPAAPAAAAAPSGAADAAPATEQQQQPADSQQQQQQQQRELAAAANPNVAPPAVKPWSVVYDPFAMQRKAVNAPPAAAPAITVRASRRANADAFQAATRALGRFPTRHELEMGVRAVETGEVRAGLHGARERVTVVQPTYQTKVPVTVEDVDPEAWSYCMAIARDANRKRNPPAPRK